MSAGFRSLKRCATCARSFSDTELTLVEDMAVRDLLALQKQAGLKIFTDGEVRRTFRHYDFMGMLTDLCMKPSTRSLPFQTEHKAPRRSRRIRPARPAFPPTTRCCGISSFCKAW